MTNYNESRSDHGSELVSYLFIWDRYRMVAKDFTLQKSATSFTALWVECHERMARWFILMDHRMKANGRKAISVTHLLSL